MPRHAPSASRSAAVARGVLSSVTRAKHAKSWVWKRRTRRCAARKAPSEAIARKFVAGGRLQPDRSATDTVALLRSPRDNSTPRLVRSDPIGHTR